MNISLDMIQRTIRVVSDEPITDRDAVLEAGRHIKSTTPKSARLWRFHHAFRIRPNIVELYFRHDRFQEGREK